MLEINRVKPQLVQVCLLHGIRMLEIRRCLTLAWLHVVFKLGLTTRKVRAELHVCVIKLGMVRKVKKCPILLISPRRGDIILGGNIAELAQGGGSSSSQSSIVVDTSMDLLAPMQLWYRSPVVVYMLALAGSRGRIIVELMGRNICTELELLTKEVESNMHSKVSLHSMMHKSISTASSNQGGIQRMLSNLSPSA